MNRHSALDLIWAKTDRTGASDEWLSLPQHLADSSETAAFLWDEFLPEPVKRYLSLTLGSRESARRLTQFLAGCHDCGKATPAFEIQGPELLVNHCRDAGLPIPPKLHDRNDLPHALAGQLILERWLTRHHGWELPQARSYASTVGGHHGVFASHTQLNLQKDSRHLLGEGPWLEVQDAVLGEVAKNLGASSYLGEWARIQLPKPAQILLTSIIIVADWIASNTDYFDYTNDLDRRATRAEHAWSALGLPTSWKPTPNTLTIDELLRTRFTLPRTASARPIQRVALDISQTIDEPGLFIIEAPMGIGKTEAALMLAEKLATRLKLGGLVFALPSMATSDAMFSRVRNWLDSATDAPESVSLAHSKAHLNDEYRGIAHQGRFAGIEHDGCNQSAQTTAMVHEWLSGRKKGVLASFVIGTIDQVLFAALKSKHVALRHLGLAGKVVIIDEVHAADEYMSVYLDRALEWLGSYGVPVVLLSATLPGQRRQAMVEAYDLGRGAHRPAIPTRPRPRKPTPAPSTSPYDYLHALDGYPLITATRSNGPVSIVVDAGNRGAAIEVSPIADDPETLENVLRMRLIAGGCAVVIRNTVGRAQQTYAQLSAAFGGDVTLLHSRFVATERVHREDELRRRFGPPSPDVDRPQRHIVVATQVLEQSLDVDFDVMITDIAPVDLILQRSGRLHRHTRADRPDPVNEPALFVTGVDWGEVVPHPDRGSIAVYGEDALLRSLAVLGLPTATTVNVPQDIPRLVQTAYGDNCPKPPAWSESMSAAHVKAVGVRVDRKRRAQNWLLPAPHDGHGVLGLTDGGVGDLKSEAKGQASVRDSQESLEVIVVQRREDGHIYRWGAPSGESPLPTELEVSGRAARAASACTLRLPRALVHPGQIDRTIAALETNLFPSWQASHWLREQLVLVFDQDCRYTLPPFELTYDNDAGLIVTHQQESHRD